MQRGLVAYRHVTEYGVIERHRPAALAVNDQGALSPGERRSRHDVARGQEAIGRDGRPRAGRGHVEQAGIVPDQLLDVHAGMPP